jgi:hypothetical protein
MPAASFFDFLIGHQTLLRRAGRTRTPVASFFKNYLEARSSPKLSSGRTPGLEPGAVPGPGTVRNLLSWVPGLASGIAQDDKRADGARPQGSHYQRREE